MTAEKRVHKKTKQLIPLGKTKVQVIDAVEQDIDKLSFLFILNGMYPLHVLQLYASLVIKYAYAVPLDGYPGISRYYDAARSKGGIKSAGWAGMGGLFWTGWLKDQIGRTFSGKIPIPASTRRGRHAGGQSYD